jgi:integrase/recombinase XerD
MSVSLQQALEDYLTIRRRLGYQLHSSGRLLAGFVRFVEQAGARTITTELAVAWARQPQGVAPIRWSQRLGMVRGFASYLATIDPDTEIPPADVLSARQQRVAPRIYSPEEIQALMHAAGELWPPVRAATMRTAIGLLAASGMRIGEMLALGDTDVDIEDGVITATGKWGKQRQVPLHPTTVQALRAYRQTRDEYWPVRPTEALLITRHGDSRRILGMSLRRARSGTCRRCRSCSSLLPAISTRCSKEGRSDDAAGADDAGVLH